MLPNLINSTHWFCSSEESRLQQNHNIWRSKKRKQKVISHLSQCGSHWFTNNKTRLSKVWNNNTEVVKNAKLSFGTNLSQRDAPWICLLIPEMELCRSHLRKLLQSPTRWTSPFLLGIQIRIQVKGYLQEQRKVSASLKAQSNTGDNTWKCHPWSFLHNLNRAGRRLVSTSSPRSEGLAKMGMFLLSEKCDIFYFLLYGNSETTDIQQIQTYIFSFLWISPES